MPPPFWAGSPYERPRPRAITPRGPASSAQGSGAVRSRRRRRPASPRSARCIPTRSVVRGGSLHQCRRISTASREPAGPSRPAPCRGPSVSSTLSADVADEPRQLGELAAGVADPARARGGEVGPVDRHRARAPDVAEPSTERRARAGSPAVTPIEENESWISIVPPSVTRVPVLADVGERRRVAVRAVDVEHVDRSLDLTSARRRRTCAGDAPGRRRRPAARLSRKTWWSSAASSANPSISCGPRSLPACGSIATISTPGAAGARQHDRRAAAEAADLDDQPAGRARVGRVVQRRRLARRHPAVDVGDGRP